MMMDNDDNSNNHDDDKTVRIKDILGIVNEEIEGDDDGEDTMYIETKVAVETVTDVIEMTDSEVTIKDV